MEKEKEKDVCTLKRSVYIIKIVKFQLLFCLVILCKKFLKKSESEIVGSRGVDS